jgi:hypothetical protein
MDVCQGLVEKRLGRLIDPVFFDSHNAKRRMEV